VALTRSRDQQETCSTVPAIDAKVHIHMRKLFMLPFHMPLSSMTFMMTYTAVFLKCCVHSERPTQKSEPLQSSDTDQNNLAESDHRVHAHKDVAQEDPKQQFDVVTSATHKEIALLQASAPVVDDAEPDEPASDDDDDKPAHESVGDDDDDKRASDDDDDKPANSQSEGSDNTTLAGDDGVENDEEQPSQVFYAQSDSDFSDLKDHLGSVTELVAGARDAMFKNHLLNKGVESYVDSIVSLDKATGTARKALYQLHKDAVAKLGEVIDSNTVDHLNAEADKQRNERKRKQLDDAQASNDPDDNAPPVEAENGSSLISTVDAYAPPQPPPPQANEPSLSSPVDANATKQSLPSPVTESSLSSPVNPHAPSAVASAPGE